MEQKIITEQPLVKRKGFKHEHLRITPATAKDVQVADTVHQLRATEAYAQLGARHRAIIDLIAESYQRKQAGLPLDPQHCLLAGHELVEFDRLEPHQVLRYLVYRYRYNKYPELKLLDEYPPCLQIEPSSICNFRCVMCYQSDPSFSSGKSTYMGFMPLELFKQVIDQAEGHVEAVTLASRGEPLLHRQIVDMLRYCRGKFLALKVNTNASVLTEEIIHALFNSDVQTIVFSIDAAEKALYERIRVRGNFERLLQNLERFRDIKAKHYPASRLITRITGVKINDEQEINQMERAWAGYADIVAFTTYTPWEDTYTNPVNTIGEACTELWRRMFVWQNGLVNPCDVDYKSLLSQWNATQMGISAIWTSGAYQQLRRHHLQQQRCQLEPCKRCIIT